MASTDDRGYAALPEPVRTLINRDYLLPAGGWHQMFGRGIEIQGDSCAMREEGLHHAAAAHLRRHDALELRRQWLLSILDLTRRSRSAELGSREDDIRMSLMKPTAQPTRLRRGLDVRQTVGAQGG
jgi:hypothetical protein